jgi:hypothetical protein
MSTSKIEMGCGKGRSCDISIYVMPQSSTKDYFTKYSKERVETMREDSASRDGDTIKNKQVNV